MVDSSTQALSYLLRFSGYTPQPLTEEERMIEDIAQREEESFLGDDMYNTYDTGEMIYDY